MHLHNIIKVIKESDYSFQQLWFNLIKKYSSYVSKVFWIRNQIQLKEVWSVETDLHSIIFLFRIFQGQCKPRSHPAKVTPSNNFFKFKISRSRPPSLLTLGLGIINSQCYRLLHHINLFTLFWLKWLTKREKIISKLKFIENLCFRIYNSHRRCFNKQIHAKLSSYYICSPLAADLMVSFRLISILNGAEVGRQWRNGRFLSGRSTVIDVLWTSTTTVRQVALFTAVKRFSCFHWWYFMARVLDLRLGII